MYDKLIKNLRHDSASALQNCEFDFVHSWMLQAADAIEELEKQLDEEEENRTELLINMGNGPIGQRHFRSRQKARNKMDNDDRCYECTGYGDDYYIDEDGKLVSACNDCPFNEPPKSEGEA